ncbi:MAG TPA: sigma-70 family RNA polymerase sigma factor [Vicinamibacterales bacterium]|jgi:RNA polymerase sigma-70 factor (ECF subfamily)
MEPIEQELVTRLRNREQDAVSDLASTYGSKVYQLALRYLKNHEDAEEVTQDVLLKVSQRIDAFRGDAALSSWIYRITFNSAMSKLRSGRAARQAAVDEAARDGGSVRPAAHLEIADPSPLADEEVLHGELRAALAKALRQLPVLYRTPIILRDIEGLSTEEASAVLRVKGQTLKSRLHRGRLILRDQLADFADGLTLHPTIH